MFLTKDIILQVASQMEVENGEDGDADGRTKSHHK